MHWGGVSDMGGNTGERVLCVVLTVWVLLGTLFAAYGLGALTFWVFDRLGAL